MRDCKTGGAITTLTGTNVGDLNEKGDIWTETPFDAFESQMIGGTSVPEPHHYWRRCHQDMSVAPAQSIRVSPKNGGDSMLIQLLEPLVIDNVDDAYKIELAFSVNTVVTGKVKPMGEWNGGLGHKSFYDVSDGFYNIAIAGLSLAPVAYKDVPGTSIVSSIGRICDSGSEPFGRIPRARFRIR